MKIAVTLLLTGGIVASVLAALVLPAALSAGLVTKAFGLSFDELPAVLKDPPTQQSTYVYAADGKTLITTFYDQNRRDVSFEEIPETMKQAIISAEDTRFYQHAGVDGKGALRALVSNALGGASQGASTLTMQYVRNVLLYSADTKAEQAAATEISSGRKLREMEYALALEQKLSKDEILRRYLNIAYFGHGAYGIFAASQTYFSKVPKDLTLDEASLLSVMVKDPSFYNPLDGNGQNAVDRRGWVLNKMVGMKYIDQATADAARVKPLALKEKKTPNSCQAGTSGFFCDYVRTWWNNQPAFGATVAEREAKLQRGGYTVVTSLDPALQAAAERNIAEQISKNSAIALNLAVVEPGTGKIKAMAVNRNFSSDLTPNGQNSGGAGKGSWPNTENALISGSTTSPGYQTGSTFKMFTMLAALEAGYPLSTEFNAPDKYKTKYPTDPGPASCDGYWCPKNAGAHMAGKRTMWDGFGGSVNTYFAWLEEKVGADKAVATAQKLGIQFRSSVDAQAAKDAESWGPFTLGVSDTTVLDLANAYATVAAEGMYCTPTPISSITGPDGKALDVAQPQCKRVIDAEVARAATDAARCTVGDKSAFGKCSLSTAPDVRGTVGRPVAGKTGTSEGDTTESFAGYTPQLAAAATAVDPDSPKSNPVGGGFASKVNAAAAKTLRDGSKGLPVKDFTAPDRKLAFGEDVSVPDVRGLAVAEAVSRLEGAGFTTAVAPGQITSTYPAGTVASTAPSRRVAPGGTITITVSKGPASATPPSPDTPNAPAPPSPNTPLSPSPVPDPNRRP